MEKVKKQINLRKIFIRYIFAFSIGTIALVIFHISLFSFGVNTGVILPANYYEKQIESQRDAIVKAKQGDDRILKQYKYVVYDFSGKIIQGNIHKNDARKIWDSVQNNEISGDGYYYAVIKRDKDVCVVLYTLHTSYKNPVLQKYLPLPDISLILSFILLFVAEVLFLSRYFGKSLSKEMLVLKKVTDKIQKEDLDFQVEQSRIVEVNEILDSLVKMKDELNDSLRKQWDMETNRRDQIAWYDKNSGGRVHEVGRKEPNAWGLYDMLGNVWEWCFDLYDEQVYGSYRIFRGGSWAEEARGCGASCRRRSHPTFRIDDLGFRLARSY